MLLTRKARQTHRFSLLIYIVKQAVVIIFGNVQRGVREMQYMILLNSKSPIEENQMSQLNLYRGTNQSSPQKKGIRTPSNLRSHILSQREIDFQ